jgi:hypothetical protein
MNGVSTRTVSRWPVGHGVEVTTALIGRSTSNRSSHVLQR